MARHSTLQLLANDIVDTAIAERTLCVAPHVETHLKAANSNQAQPNFNPERLSGFCASA